MAKTLLAVDDSVTMRKVLEITFSGEDFRVITADNAQSALGKLGENPAVFVVDTVLGADAREDGYALAKELRKRNPGASIILLASRYAPFDQARGRDAGADDWADKPFDTQQLIDKVRKVVLAKEAAGGQHPTATAPPAPMAAAPPQAPPYRAPAPPQPPPVASHAASQNTGGSGGLGRGTQPSLGGSAQGVRTGTLVFGEGGGGASAPPPHAPPQAPRSTAPQVASQAAPQVAPQAPPASPMATTGGAPVPGAAIGAAVNGHLAGKLGELGLSPQQADAVLALSRDVVERVVWEVVPQLAETMIKEEIQRLMKA